MVACSPDVGISIPVQNMVENSLEKNGPKVLLPQITDAVKVIQKTAPQETVTATESEPLVTNTGPTTSSPEASSGNSELGPLDIPMPISIPGLNTTGSRRETGGGSDQGVKPGGKREGVAEGKVKLTSKTESGSSNVASAGSAASSGGGWKTGRAGTTKTGRLAGSRVKAKEEKSQVEEKVEERDGTETEGSLGVRGKESEVVSGKGKMGKEKENSSQREPVKQTEKAASSRDEEPTTNSSGEDTKPDSMEKETLTKQGAKTDNVPEKTTEAERQEAAVEETSEPSTPVSIGGSSRRRKQSVPKRRSARLSSLEEEQGEGETDTPSEKTQRSPPEDTSLRDSSKPAEFVRKKVAVAEKKKISAGTTTLKTTSSSGRKKPRVLESSSDEESVTTQQQTNSEEEEKGYESETEQQMKEEEDGRRRKRKVAKARDKRTTVRDSSQETKSESSSQRLPGQKRNLDARGEDEAGGNESTSSSPVPKKAKGKLSGKEDRKHSPAGSSKQKSPSPVVVTRFVCVGVMANIEFSLLQVQQESEAQSSVHVSHQRQWQQLLTRRYRTKHSI